MIGSGIKSPPRFRRVSTWFFALRPGQWIKNLLVLGPVLFAHQAPDRHTAFALAVSFVSMCLAASAGYLVNDVLDMSADNSRAHKRNRAICSGKIRPGSALKASCSLAALAIIFPALLVSVTTTLMIASYILATLMYSAFIKKYFIIDVVFLAALYLLRLAVGGEASGVQVSLWLIVFGSHLFISLGLMKRLEELVERKKASTASLPRRGYAHKDLSMVLAVCVLSAFGSVATLAAYIMFSEVAKVHYPSHVWLWLGLVVFICWLLHMLRQAIAGRTGGDPLLFAMTDAVSLSLVVAGAIACISALRG